MAAGVKMDGKLVAEYFDPRVQKLFEHAVDSIEMGIMDYCSSACETRRLMSAVRNVDAGLELLCKTAIASNGFKRIIVKETVDKVVTIGMKEILQEATTWNIEMADMLNLHHYRNDVEHLYPENRYVARQYLGRSFVWMFNFFKTELLRDPQREFSRGIWEFLLNEKGVADSETSQMEESFSELDLPDYEMTELAPGHFKCPSCLATIVHPVNTPVEDLRFACRLCAREFDYRGLVDAVYPNCICEFCGRPLEDSSEMEVFNRTGYCGRCEHNLSKND